MKKLVYEIDPKGYFVRDKWIEEHEVATEKYVEVFLEHGLYNPRFVDGVWVNGIGNEEILNQYKKTKIKELRTLCEQTIMGRFTCNVNGTDYQFSCDDRAQANFEKVDNAFTKGRSTEEPWTAYTMDGQVIRLLLTPAIFEIVYVAHLQHIRDNISKFRDFLMPLVEGATTVEEINAISW